MSEKTIGKKRSPAEAEAEAKAKRLKKSKK